MCINIRCVTIFFIGIDPICTLCCASISLVRDMLIHLFTLQICVYVCMCHSVFLCVSVPNNTLIWFALISVVWIILMGWILFICVDERLFTFHFEFFFFLLIFLWTFQWFFLHAFFMDILYMFACISLSADTVNIKSHHVWYRCLINSWFIWY